MMSNPYPDRKQCTTAETSEPAAISAKHHAGGRKLQAKTDQTGHTNRSSAHNPLSQKTRAETLLNGDRRRRNEDFQS